MKKVEIYDPAMCCSTGVCGPSVDPELTKVASAIYTLEKKGLPIKRYNLANDPAAFAENETINKLLHEQGTDSLPIVLVDGEVFKVGGYPTTKEFADLYQIEEKELEAQKPKKKLNVIHMNTKEVE
ncbi:MULTISPECIES: arsenite efflux transporter metallochaperone ArsD [Bacillus]|uniref:arsenite efflux transporter metallochaperone ArsD n=1 Tax=Bacillus TaxID=1386 RepID=UPI000BA52B15|nr:MULTISPECIES: arsenite efflux transporter metallochaperone ArsD [Bacillus]MBA1163631.1 arsenite efflux transporter metallochaperone ArsD [Bacillus licheniformis]MBS2762870.1 arsenite efflux transporter metallochaperone ArsD [Bacillus licheniformis]PAK33322.1 arsenical resistance operon transcriptional repressor ArsD [Bacillus licheniformis]TWK57286.1 Arsenical resistance operon trans-acting repressor ArsD [Bacillus licheniformis]